MSIRARTAIGVIVSGGLLGLLLSQIDVRGVFANLSRMGVSSNVAAFALLAISYLFRALRFQVLLSPDDPPLPRMMRVTTVYMFMLRVLPFRTGELSYLYLIRRASSASLAKAAATLAFSRVLDIITVLALFSAAAAVEVRLPRTTAGIAVLLLLLTVLLWFLDRPARWLALLLSNPRLGRGRFRERLRSFAACTADETAQLRKKGAYLPAVALTLFAWLAVFWMFYVFLRGFGVDVSPAAALCGSTASVAAASLPIGGIGAFGPVEAGWAAGFIAVGLDKQTAISTGISMNLAVFVYSALLAGSAVLSDVCLRASRRARSG
jgi:uncharacterized protein (TIRG00374 family)